MRDENVIYAQVLLLDGKIENWKICQDKKNGIYDFKAYWKPARMEDYTMETKIFKADVIDVPSEWGFNAYVYNQLAPRWINHFPYADDFRMGRCIEKTYEQHTEEIKSFERAFGGRYKIVGTLGAN